MDLVRECHMLVGQFGRRVLCWVHLAEPPAAILKKDDAVHIPADFTSDDEEDVCAICTEPLAEGGDILSLPCDAKHVFHLACIRQWAAVNLTCPLDRKPIPSEALVKLNLFNSLRLYTSVFLEEVVSGASQYLMWHNLLKDFPVNLLGLAIHKCGNSFVNRIDQSLYTRVPPGTVPLPAWSRTPVLGAGNITFQFLFWTAYSSIGYTSLVLHYLLRQGLEAQGRILCTRVLRLGNVGYDYTGTKQLLSRSKLTRIIKGIGFLLGLVVVGREVRRGSQHLASVMLAYICETVPLAAAT